MPKVKLTGRTQLHELQFCVPWLKGMTTEHTDFISQKAGLELGSRQLVDFQFWLVECCQLPARYILFENIMPILAIFAAPEAKPAQKKKKGKQTTLLKSPPEKEKQRTDKKMPPEKNDAASKK